MIVILPTAYSQSPLIWSKDAEAGQSYYYSDSPSILAEDNAINVIGIKNEPDGQVLQVLKYSLDGELITSFLFGSDSVSNNMIVDYKFDSENNLYILCEEFQGNTNTVIQKYSKNGDLVWVEKLKGINDTSFIPHTIGIENDSLIYISAYKEHHKSAPGSDIILVKKLAYLYLFDCLGNKIWQREFNPNTEIYRFASDLFINNKTAYLLADNTTYENVLVKIDISNNLTLNSNTGIIYGYDMQLTPDRNLLITSGASYRITKTNLDGDMIWSKFYGTNIPDNNAEGDKIKYTIQDDDGNIYITGFHFGSYYPEEDFSNYDILTLKYDSEGNLIWENRYQYNMNNADMGNYIVLKNGYVYIGGQSQRGEAGSDYDCIILKINSETGILNGVYRYNGIENTNEVITSLFVFDDGKVALTGLYNNDNGKYDWKTQLISDIISSVQNTMVR